nr:ABC transporter permease [Nocardioides albus]
MVLVALVAIAVLASFLGRLGAGREQVGAALRAVVQLAVVSLVIAAALSSLWSSLAFAALMFVVASTTSARRIGVPWRQLPWVATGIAAGAFPIIGLCLISGVVPFNGAGIIPVAGILIGGAMTASTLTGRRASDEIKANHGSYEAALALGLPAAEAAFVVLQPTAKEALMPGLDQTRTVGLVTLPGAFIGVLLGGGTPLDAGAAQVLVLLGLLAVQAITSAVLLRLIARAKVVRRDLVAIYPR